MTASLQADPAPVAPPRRLSLWLLAIVLAYLVLTWIFGGAETLAAARRIGPAWIVAGLGLTAFNFAVRALRWHWLLRAMGVRVSPAVNGAVYLAGIALSATPGKVGETVRSVFLLRHGVPVGTSLAAFVADRLSDLHAVLLIALLPLAWMAGFAAPEVQRWAALLLAVAVAPMLLRRAMQTRAWPRTLALVQGTRGLKSLGTWLASAAVDFTRLWRPSVACMSILASAIAFGAQAFIFVGMVGEVAPGVPAVTAISIFGIATLAGAASMLPGGVGAMELALVLLLRQQGVDGASALAVALCLRAVTFWFGLLLGAAGLGVAARLRKP